MSGKLTEFDIQVLEWLAGERELAWGAAVSVTLEYLSGLGLVTKSIPYEITPAGRAALSKGGTDE